MIKIKLNLSIYSSDECKHNDVKSLTSTVAMSIIIVVCCLLAADDFTVDNRLSNYKKKKKMYFINAKIKNPREAFNMYVC